MTSTALLSSEEEEEEEPPCNLTSSHHDSRSSEQVNNDNTKGTATPIQRERKYKLFRNIARTFMLGMEQGVSSGGGTWNKEPVCVEETREIRKRRGEEI